MPTTSREIDMQIRRLQERKALIAERDSAVQPAIETLIKYADVLTPAQRRKVARLVADDGIQQAMPNRAKKAPKKAAAKVAPKYQLPTGELWSGRGRMPNAFATWARSRAGRSWAKENPDAKFPPADGSAAASAPAPLKKVAKKAGKKGTKRVGKRTQEGGAAA